MLLAHHLDCWLLVLIRYYDFKNVWCNALYIYYIKRSIATKVDSTYLRY